MSELKFDIIFWDGGDKDTIEHISCEEAWSEGCIEFSGNELVPTDECTIIREYTGLKDCKRTEEYPEGQEIFKGDIVQIDTGHKAVCIYCNERGEYRFNLMRSYLFGGSASYAYCFYEQFEKIGNIHENPELLN